MSPDSSIFSLASIRRFLFLALLVLLVFVLVVLDIDSSQSWDQLVGRMAGQVRQALDCIGPGLTCFACKDVDPSSIDSDTDWWSDT